MIIVVYQVSVELIWPVKACAHVIIKRLQNEVCSRNDYRVMELEN